MSNRMKDALKEDLGTTPKEARPAFPTNNRMFSEAQGLTQREYIAIEAMKALIMLNPESIKGNIDMPVPDLVAKYAIEYADELLKQLKV